MGTSSAQVLVPSQDDPQHGSPSGPPQGGPRQTDFPGGGRAETRQPFARHVERQAGDETKKPFPGERHGAATATGSEDAEQPPSGDPHDTGCDEGAGDRIGPEEPAPEEPEQPPQNPPRPRHLPADMPPEDE